MRYAHTELRDRLAAAYVLGTLSGRARARFASLLKYDSELRTRVRAWEQRITPMALAAPDVVPPPRLWQRIAARIGLDRTSAPARRFGWRTLAGFGAAVALMLAVYIGSRPAEPPVEMIAVMTDARGQASMVVSWPEQRRLREPQIKLRIVEDRPHEPVADAVHELWLLSKDPQVPPRSLGVIGADKDQIIRLAADTAGIIDNAWGLALSVEPAGGSPTGTPTGPMLYKGRCIKII